MKRRGFLSFLGLAPLVGLFLNYFGLGPEEPFFVDDVMHCAYFVSSDGKLWSLRDYGDPHAWVIYDGVRWKNIP
jgi:hypothetical protein